MIIYLDKRYNDIIGKRGGNKIMTVVKHNLRTLCEKRNPQELVEKICDMVIDKYGLDSPVTSDILDVICSTPCVYKDDRERVLTKFFNGEWVDTEYIKKYLGINFALGYKLFDFSRTAEWNNPPLNGQHINTQFRLKK